MADRRQSLKVLVDEHNKRDTIGVAKRLEFIGVDGFDVYNPSIPFEYNRQKCIVGRVESRDSEASKAMFFQESEGKYHLIEEMKVFELQDPFITKVQGKWILGGTETFPHPDNPENLWWRTAFYYGEELNDLELLAYGPNGMKDIRLVDLKELGIGVFTRPQGDVGGRGKIGFIKIDSLDELSSNKIEQATLLEQFFDDEWGGVNQAMLLSNGQIGVIGHIANFSNDSERHYCSMAFTLNPLNLDYSPMKIIAVRNDYLEGESKRGDLKDVLFSAGIEYVNDNVFLYTGVSDIEVQVKEIKDPFKI